MRPVIPRLAQTAMLGLFTAGLALQSLHLGHDLIVDEAVECACAATDRPESAVHVLPAGFGATDVEIVEFAPTVAVPARDSVVSHGARAPPLV